MTLRSKLIKLAHSNPNLRPHLLPMLKQSRDGSDIDPQQMQHLYDGLHKGLRSMEKASRGVDLALSQGSWEDESVVRPMWDLITESERFYAALKGLKIQWVRSGRMG